MASCSLNVVLAPNGKVSNLHKEAMNKYGKEMGVRIWTYVNSPAFKETFGNWKSSEFESTDKLDINGEPLLDEVLKLNSLQHIEELESITSSIEHMEKYASRIKNMEDKIHDSLQRKISSVRGEQGEGIANSLKQLQKKLRPGSWELNMIEYMNRVGGLMQGTVKKLQEVLEDKAIGTDGKPIPPMFIKSLMRSIEAFDSIEPLYNAVVSDPLLKELFSNAGVLEKASAAIHDASRARELYDEYRNKVTSEALHKASKGVLTLEEIQTKLREVQGDISGLAAMTLYAGDSTDPIVALAANLVRDKQHETRFSMIDFNKRHIEVLQKLEDAYPGSAGNSKQLFSPMLAKDKNGSITNYLITQENNPQQYAEFKKAYNGTAMMDYYNFYMEHYTIANAGIPNSRALKGRIPAIVLGDVRRAKGTNKIKALGDKFKQAMFRTSMDEEFGESEAGSNTAINRIPIHGTQTMEYSDYIKKYNQLIKEGLSEEEANTAAKDYAREKFPEYLDYDLGKGLTKFYENATAYNNLTEVRFAVEGALEAIEKRDVIEVDSKFKVVRKIKSMLRDDRKKTIKGGKTSNAYTQLDEFIKAHLYGQKTKDLGKSFGIDRATALKNIRKATSTLLMGANVMSAMNNISVGTIGQWIEGVSKEFYSTKSQLKAKAMYMREIGGTTDLYNRSDDNIITLINNHYDVLGDYRPEGHKQSDVYGLQRLFKGVSLQVLNTMGEHIMQSQANLAAMYEVKMLDANGKETGKTLVDIHSSVDGKLVIEEGHYYKNPKGKLVPFDKQAQKDFSNRTSYMLRKMHGNYAQKTAAAYSRNGYMMMLGQYRKWLPEGYNRRFGIEAENFQKGDVAKGFYTSAGQFMGAIGKDLKKLDFANMATHFNNLSKTDKANLRRFTMEMVAIALAGAAVYMLTAALAGMGDDDDEALTDAQRAAREAGKRNLRIVTYLAARLRTELLSYIWVGSLGELVTNPAASMSVLNRAGDLLTQLAPWNAGEEVQSGYNKGRLKAAVKAEKLIPVYANLQRLTPHGAKATLDFLNLN